MSAAPLKQGAAVRPGGLGHEFPRSNERGPIEAVSAWFGEAASTPTFPRSNERGPIEACHESARSHDREGAFPRSNERGPIEAMPRRLTFTPAWTKICAL